MNVAETTIVGKRYPLLRERLSHDIERFRKFTAVLIKNRLAFAGIVIIALFTVLSFGAPLLVGPYPSQLQRTTDNLPPSSAHWLGTDWEGFDILTLLVYGGQISLIIRVSASLVAMVLGTFMGVLCGFYGGISDLVLSPKNEFFLLVPLVPVVPGLV